MLQYICFSLLFIAVLAGFFSYFDPLQNSPSPMQFLVDRYNKIEAPNQKQSQKISTMTSQGLTGVRDKMDALQQEQQRSCNNSNLQQSSMGCAQSMQFGSQQWMDDLQQKSRDMIEEERQKQQEEQELLQQRIADMQQRMEDQQSK